MSAFHYTECLCIDNKEACIKIQQTIPDIISKQHSETVEQWRPVASSSPVVWSQSFSAVHTLWQNEMFCTRPCQKRPGTIFTSASQHKQWCYKCSTRLEYYTCLLFKVFVKFFMFHYHGYSPISVFPFHLKICTVSISYLILQKLIDYWYTDELFQLKTIFLVLFTFPACLFTCKTSVSPFFYLLKLPT